MMKWLLAVAVLATLAFGPPTRGEPAVYRCTAEGSTKFQDFPCDGDAAGRRAYGNPTAAAPIAGPSATPGVVHPQGLRPQALYFPCGPGILCVDPGQAMLARESGLPERRYLCAAAHGVLQVQDAPCEASDSSAAADAEGAPARGAVSYRCTANNGLWYYQHQPCAGDPGTRYLGNLGPMKEEVVPRDVACREIERQTSDRLSRWDQKVSTYDKNQGRDPCR